MAVSFAKAKAEFGVALGELTGQALLAGTPLPPELATVSGKFIDEAEKLLRLKTTTKIMQTRQGHVMSENIPPATMDEKLNRGVLRKQEEEAQAGFGEACAAMLEYLSNAPDNPFPFSYRRGLAAALHTIGEVMADQGLVLSDDFFAAVKVAEGGTGKRAL